MPLDHFNNEFCHWRFVLKCAEPKEVPPPPEGPKLKSKWCTHPKSHFTWNEYQMVPEKVHNPEGPNNNPKISPCVARTLKKRNHTFWLQNHHKCSQRLQQCTHASLEVAPSQRKQRVGESLGGNGRDGRPVSSTHQLYITPHSPIHMCVCPHWYSPSCSRWFWISAGRQMSSSRCRHGTYGGPPKVHKTVKITLWAFLKC